MFLFAFLITFILLPSQPSSGFTCDKERQIFVPKCLFLVAFYFYIGVTLLSKRGITPSIYYLLKFRLQYIKIVFLGTQYQGWWCWCRNVANSASCENATYFQFFLKIPTHLHCPLIYVSVFFLMVMGLSPNTLIINRTYSGKNTFLIQLTQPFIGCSQLWCWAYSAFKFFSKR